MYSAVVELCPSSVLCWKDQKPTWQLLMTGNDRVILNSSFIVTATHIIMLILPHPRPRPAQPFTPYSTTLGNIVRELHRSLLLALTAESHSTTLTQLIKAVSVLVANAPYHKLSDGYLTKILATLHRFSRHKGERVWYRITGNIGDFFPNN